MMQINISTLETLFYRKCYYTIGSQLIVPKSVSLLLPLQ